VLLLCLTELYQPTVHHFHFAGFVALFEKKVGAGIIVALVVKVIINWGLKIHT